MTLQEEITRRRTFAVIAHPDAGKTTLTEKLLLFGGAIHVAGAVKSNKIKKGATSDFMEIERQRGISVATSVMGFEYQGRKINILDTPGHEDFAEDTYRTLTAVDSVIIVIDGAKGVESQTRKLMDVCRMRQTPSSTSWTVRARIPSTCWTKSRRNSASGYVPSHSRFRAATPSRAFTTSTRRTSHSLRATNGRRPTPRP